MNQLTQPSEFFCWVRNLGDFMVDMGDAGLQVDSALQPIFGPSQILCAFRYQGIQPRGQRP